MHNKGHKSPMDIEKLLAAFPEQNPNPVLSINKSGQVLYYNKAGKELFHEWCCQQGTFAPQSLMTIIEKANPNNNVEISVDDRLHAFTVIPVLNGEALFIYGRDITKQRETELKLKRLTNIIHESINLVYITDHQGIIEYANHTFEKVSGFSKEEAIGQNPRILKSGETKAEQYHEMWSKIRAGKTWRGLLKNRKKDGDYYWVNGFISPIKDDEGIVTNYLAIQEDITEKVATEERLLYLADYDLITGTMNRVHFVQLFNKKIIEAATIKNAVLLQVNIDGFKLINDSFGHTVGDQFLKEFADFLLKQVKNLDISFKPEEDSIVARLGGDEFVVLLFSRKEREGTDTAERIRQSVEGYRFLNGTTRVTVSIGVAIYPEHGLDSCELLTRSNAAINNAKDLGQNRYSLYSTDEDYLKTAKSILEEKQRIITAMEEGRIIPWFQPILDLKSGKVYHYESLARLITPDGKVLSPASFIPTAERYGLISNIDRIIAEKSINKQSEEEKNGNKLSFSMNLSGKYLGDLDMLYYLQTAIKNANADPTHIIFEITETAAINNMSSAITFIKELKSMGCKISLDDFGVGFTSFTHLVELDVDYLKIDGSFVRRLPESKRDRVLVKTITDMAKSLNIKTVAEFVDQAEIIDILKSFGVDYAQGYYIGKPTAKLLD